MNRHLYSDSEISFHPHSIWDHNMRLFRWKGQLYRGISSERAAFFTQLFEDGSIQTLVDKGLLIESELTPLEIGGFSMVVSHQTVAFNSYSIEWCAAMVKDAALTILELAIELGKRGFSLEDGHLGNVLFDGCKPVFVDLGSIRPIDEYVHYFRWIPYEQFCQSCVYPLILMSQGKDRVARLLMIDYEGISKSDFLLLIRGAGRSVQLPNLPVVTSLQLWLMRVLPREHLSFLKKNLSPILAFLKKQSHTSKSESELVENYQPKSESELVENYQPKPQPEFFVKIKQKAYLKVLEKTRQDVKSINLPSCKTELSNKSEISILSLSHQDSWTAKQVAVYKCLIELKPSSVLDIGCHTGWYSKLAALLGSQVVAFDKDPACITQLYYDAREQKLPILPLVIDFTQSTPSYGLSNYRYIAATERFQCEMVLALGLFHHIVFEQYPLFDQAVDGLGLFSKRWLIVEFVPIEDPALAIFRSPRHSWYTLENFLNALSKRFSSIHTMPSHSESRVLLLCEK
jgi:SAM-dependent methyltransferase